MNVAQKPGKRELNRQNNQKAILDAARECFSEAGFDKVTVRDIIRRTGLASGTFYNYFPDKKSIFLALIDDYMARLDGHVNHSPKASNLKEHIQNSYLAIFTTIVEDPVVYQLVHANEKTVQEICGTSVFGKALSNLEADIDQAIESNQLPNIDTEFLVASFYGVGYEIGLKLAKTNADPKRAAHFATLLFLGGLDQLSKSDLDR
ncbi:MAG: TetR family transcriptional regulator [Gammaproteobacteria bacterium]|nr:MAG: TetR family transcriptional regulator [Gammaproteobacteria bacterium]